MYVRPLPEMNGHWNDYAAFNRDGSSRGPQNSTAALQGVRADRAARQGWHDREHQRPTAPPRAAGGAGQLPPTQARIVWNPQGYGSPDIPANAARRTTPATRT